MGSGASTVSGHSSIKYTWGAQTAGGALDGGAAGITASNFGVIELVGTYSNSADRFTINATGSLRGSGANLKEVYRVSSFTDFATATHPEVILATGAMVTDTNTSSPSSDLMVQNLGTNHDLLFGLGCVNVSATPTYYTKSLTIGFGTPWMGLGKDHNGINVTTTGLSANVGLQAGTITINDGKGTFTEMLIRSSGYADGANYARLYLGNGANCPVFTTVDGGNKVVARVVGPMSAAGVVLNSTAPQFAGGISKFKVGGTEPGYLIAAQANATGGVPIERRKRRLAPGDQRQRPGLHHGDQVRRNAVPQFGSQRHGRPVHPERGHPVSGDGRWADRHAERPVGGQRSASRCRRAVAGPG